MDLVTVICTGTQEAFAKIAVRPGMKGSDIDAEKATTILRQVVIERYDKVVADLKEVLDANLSEQWLRQALNVACLDLANEALKRYQA